MSISRLVTLPKSVRISLPAEVRTRWKTRRLIVIDLGDRVSCVRPRVGPWRNVEVDLDSEG